MLHDLPTKTAIEMNMSGQVGPSSLEEQLSVVEEDQEADASFDMGYRSSEMSLGWGDVCGARRRRRICRYG
ncbi:hypothetical protein FIBSPDRAFT_872271 [Athelia psychrophila]|uniref:Uncharacterized protein n=1 Tax=Athelia psychrophila TaxID=1759441 RepID=A0A165ZQ99_9AGAM|nr:hypothetical protein FIBSPDRAFT_872271 [Fibularhizoctonia sp. CBS 109695]